MAGSDHDKPRSSGGLEDTVPASEPPLDIHGQPMRSSRASIPPVTHERYRHGPELGRGGMGRVVEAFDTQLGRTVALKEVLPKGASVARRFIREVEITARLEHASIVPLYDSGTSADGRPFYVMRRVSGRPLDEQIGRARGLGERLTLLPALLAAIDAVAHAHKRGIIHRDLKPANILVGELGETVVIDWGLAKVIGEEDEDTGGPMTPTANDSLQTQIGSVFGTPGFMSPEQARGEPLSTRSDVYALGATLYHLLAGTPPHAGDSATIVLGRTLKHDVIPLDEAAPGAPPELVAIVDKALAFEADARYANAAALGEDVRRFLAGQLVAAHRYTPRQRLGRFAKRHRTSLAIAALAMVAVAALAWFSVHRIVQERDAATAARQAALADKRAAEAARDSLAERNDALLLTQARALVEGNPTEALAVLKQLPQASVRLPEARVIAQAAVARGAWWGMQSTGVLTTRVELSPDGKQLLQVTRDNIIRVWDLDRRRLVIARPYPTAIVAIWSSGGRVLVYGDEAPPELLDPGANQATQLSPQRFDRIEASEAGDRLLGYDHQGAASWIDVATGALTPLWGGRKTRIAEIAPEGTWGLVGDDKMVVAIDASGKELIRVDGESPHAVTSRHRTFAVTSRNKLVECRLDPVPACTELASPIQPRPIAVDLIYRGRELLMFAGNGDVIGWVGGRGGIRERIDQFMNGMSEVGDELTVIPTFSGRLHVVGSWVRFSLLLPSPVSLARVATRANHSRVVVVGHGQILVTDLAAVMPRRFAGTGGSQGVFADDDTLLLWRMGRAWSWVDVATGTVEPISTEIRGLPFLRDVGASSVLMVDDYGTGGRLLQFRRGMPVIEIATGVHPWASLVPGNAVIFGTSQVRPDGAIKADGRVLAKVGTAEPREVVKLDGEVISSVGFGALQFAVLSDRGELVRGNLATNAIERTTVAAGTSNFVTAESGGRVIVTTGDRLLLWDKDLVEIARFDNQIRSVARGDRGRILVTLLNNEVYITEIEPGARPNRLLSGGQYAPEVSTDGRTLVATGNGLQLTVVELASANRWTLPMMYSAIPVVAVSPSSRQIAQGTHSGLMLWTLPTTSADFGVWLDEQTNATKIGDEVLAWPWQVRKP
jgi:hypothetical protein